MQFPAKNWRMSYFVSLVTTRSVRSRINNFLVLDLFHCLDLLFCCDLFCYFTLSFVRLFVVQTFTFVAFCCFTLSRSTFSQLISFPFLRCLSALSNRYSFLLNFVDSRRTSQLYQNNSSDFPEFEFREFASFNHTNRKLTILSSNIRI